MRTYYKTKEAHEAKAKEYESQGMAARAGSIECDSGEASCFRVENEANETIDVLVLDEYSYENAPLKERGE